MRIHSHISSDKLSKYIVFSLKSRLQNCNFQRIQLIL